MLLEGLTTLSCCEASEPFPGIDIWVRHLRLSAGMLAEVIDSFSGLYEHNHHSYHHSCISCRLPDAERGIVVLTCLSLTRNMTVTARLHARAFSFESALKVTIQLRPVNTVPNGGHLRRQCPHREQLFRSHWQEHTCNSPYPIWYP